MPDPASYAVCPVFPGLTIPTAAFWLHHLMPLSLCDCITTTTSWFISATFISSNYRIWNITILLSRTLNISQILIRSSMTFLLESATSTGTSAPLVLLRRQSCLICPAYSCRSALLAVCTILVFSSQVLWQTDRTRERHTHIQRHRVRDRETDTETEQQRERVAETHTEKHTERNRALDRGLSPYT